MRKRLDGKERRRLIVEAAVSLFALKGFRGTTTKEVAEAVGCSEGTIFKYFATKEDLYSAILEEKAQIEETLAKASQAAASKDDTGVFRTVGLELLTQTEKDPSLMRLLLFSALEGHKLSEIFFHSRVKRIHEFLSRYINGRISEGVFRPVDPLVTARAFVGMVVHYLLIHMIFGVEKPPDAHPERIINTFVSLFLNGIKR